MSPSLRHARSSDQWPPLEKRNSPLRQELVHGSACLPIALERQTLPHELVLPLPSAVAGYRHRHIG